MRTNRPPTPRALRVGPLAASLASLFALSGPAAAIGPDGSTPLLGMRAALPLLSQRPAQRTARPATRAASLAAASVTSCGDDPNDFATLRHAVLVANPGDTIDLGATPCSTITLQHAIDVSFDDLTIRGPGAGKLTIDGNQVDRVFKHTGAGTLTLSALTVARGSYSADNAYGGCIYSKGSIELDAVTLTSCKALGQKTAVGGGAVAFGPITLRASVVAGNLADAAVGGGPKVTSALGGGLLSVSQQYATTLIESVVSGNTAHAPSGLVEGGGVVAQQLSAKYTTFSGNHAIAAGNLDNYSAAGAFAALQSASLSNVTIDHNDADIAGGAFFANGGTVTIAQTTISGNVGNLAVGGVVVDASATIANSTIAFNTGGALAGGGLVSNGSYTLSVNSTIIADNSPSDFDGASTLSGANNLIKVAGPTASMLPAGTITLDPLLGPLEFNGGRTRTHLLLPGSPALNAGNNVANQATDQRGGAYERQFGAQPDIGAVEIDPDHIYGDRFGL